MFTYELFQLSIIIIYVKTLKIRHMSTNTIHKMLYLYLNFKVLNLQGKYFKMIKKKLFSISY